MAKLSHGPITGLAFSLLLTGAAGAQTTTTPPPGDAGQPVQAPKAEAPKPAAPGGLTISFGDTSIKFGVLLQPQADWSQDQTGGYQQNMGLRRTRFNVSGNVTKNVYFFYQLENARLGFASTTTTGGTTTTTKTISSGIQTLDAVLEWRIHKMFNIWGGLIYLPTSRDALKSSASQFYLDQGTWAYTATGVLAGTGGRDTGFMARGYFVDDRLEYRIGAFSGVRETGSRNAYRYIGRVQYNFFDKEVYNLPAYVGANLGAKKILAVGAAYDTQMHYTGATADVFADIPTAFGSVVGMAAWQRLNGGTSVAMPRSNIFQIEGGAYFKNVKLGPWLRYEQRIYSDDSQKGRGEKRWLAGLNYYIKGHNANAKLAYGRVNPESPVTGNSLNSTNQFVIQLQAYY